MTQAMEGLERVHKEETVQRAENLEREDFVCLKSVSPFFQRAFPSGTFIPDFVIEMRR